MDWKSWVTGKIAGDLWDSLFKSRQSSEMTGSSSLHIVDVIQNTADGDVVFVKSQTENFNTKSVLMVMPGEEAIFIDNGRIVEIFPEGRYVLDTSNYPVLNTIIKKFSGNKSVFSSQIYFIRKVNSYPMDWGTSIEVRDPIQLISTRVMCRGIYTILIMDSKRFLEYYMGNGWGSLSAKELSYLLKDKILQTIKNALSSFIMDRFDEIMGITRHQKYLAETIERDIKMIYIQYGISISSFTITGLDILQDQNREEIENAYKRKRIKEIEKK